VLTPFDEFPVHQSPYPFSYVPSTDTAWDDGYFFGVLSPDAEVFLYTGLRVSPNTDMIGGYAGVVHQGRQTTVRVSREWRGDFDIGAGPLPYPFIEPFKDIRLPLEPFDGADLAFDLHWLGRAPAYEEEHHLAWSRGRRTTDQTRYSQSGTATGWIQLGDRRFEVSPGSWYGSRDHSWGLYAQRPPLAPSPKLLPPKEIPAVRRAFRFWTNFGTSGSSGFYHLHESEDGRQVLMNDTFGTPFSGGVDRGWDGHTSFVSAEHALTFRSGTRVMESAVIRLVDEHGGRWTQRFTNVGSPWSPIPIGYGAGSWRDGGSMHTYHGPPNHTGNAFVEWDSFDVSVQPWQHQLYHGPLVPAQGTEYLARVESTDPSGETQTGAAHIEIFIDGRFDPYGFTGEANRGHA